MIGALVASAAAGAASAARAAWVGKQQQRVLAAQARRRLEADVAGRLAPESVDDESEEASDD